MPYRIIQLLMCLNFQPYQPVKAATLAKWLLSAMDGASIDTTKYRAHSSRSAASSAMLARGFSLAQILKRADWSRASTFHKFYARS